MWPLLRPLPAEALFTLEPPPSPRCTLARAQVCGGYPDAIARLAQLINDQVSCDFVDLNCGGSWGMGAGLEQCGGGWGRCEGVVLRAAGSSCCPWHVLHVHCVAMKRLLTSPPSPACPRLPH